MTLTKEMFLKEFKDCLEYEYSTEPKGAKPWQIHNAVAEVIMNHLKNDIQNSRKAHEQSRRACYFSAEFLVGRAIYNNLLCLSITDIVDEALKDCELSLSMLEEIEDAALGNGGLGRLAACFLDSAATLNLPLDGYGIRYKYGLFKQDIKDGFQVEEADDWTYYGDNWSKRKAGEAVKVEFANQAVWAVPYDMPIVGYHTKNVGNLRLWQAESINTLDFKEFDNQNYDASVSEKNRAEDISRVLYPNDNTTEGKILRLKQQYFFCSASITDILRTYKKLHGTNWNSLSYYISVQLNDTHPTVSIPELIRQLVDNEGVSFNEALSIAKKTFNYTNHTIMAEALEKWPIDLMNMVIPRIYEIIELINQELQKEMEAKKLSKEEIDELKIVSNGLVYMARLAIYASSYTNGVAQIHTEILKNDALKEWYAVYPERFQNKTNGVTQRRWLALCNKELTAFLKENLQNDNFITNLNELKKLEPLAAKKEIIDEFKNIKQLKKHQLAEYIKEHDGIEIDENSIFDIQIKRLHEYKRQLLNAFSILWIYYGIKDGTIKNFNKTTFLFGAKSAPGYFRAKGIIKFINEVANLVNNDPETSPFMKVVFLKNYNVSYAEKLVAAADVSVQISTAGTEASGTGNMKLMINGAVTLGTLDGANVEIVEEAGIENNYIFGAKVEDLEKIMPTYNPKELYNSNANIRRVVDTLIDGTFNDSNTGMFHELYNALLNGTDWQKADYYYLLGDMQSFVEERLRLNNDYKNKDEFTRKCFINTCNSGKFSSDMTINHYAKEIWKIEPININW